MVSHHVKTPRLLVVVFQRLKDGAFDPLNAM